MIGGHLTWNPPTVLSKVDGWAVYRDGQMVAVTVLGRDHAEALRELCRTWQPHVPVSRWTIEHLDL